MNLNTLTSTDDCVKLLDKDIKEEELRLCKSKNLLVEINYRRAAFELAALTDYKVAARVGTANFFSTYLPMAVGLGLGAGLAQFSINAANNVNGKR